MIADRPEVTALENCFSAFLESLENESNNSKAVTYLGRFLRGKTYANNGSVFDLSIKNRIINAKVKGKSQAFYDVNISFKQFSTDNKNFIINLLSKNSLLSKIEENSELANNLVLILQKSNISVFPKDWNEIIYDCNCPDYVKPCKHIIAVLCLLKNEILKNPLAIFDLRGIDILSKKNNLAQEKIITKTLDDYSVPKPINVIETDAWTATKIPHLLVQDSTSFDSSLDVISSIIASTKNFEPVDLKTSLIEFYHKAIRVANDILSTFEYIEYSNFEQEKFSKMNFVPVFEPYNKVYIYAKDDFGYSETKYSVLEIAKCFLSCSVKNGSDSYEFFKNLFSLLKAIICASAFYPDVQTENDTFYIIWKPFLDNLSIKKDFLLLENYCIPFENKYYQTFDKHSTMLIIFHVLLSEFVRAVNFVPSSFNKGNLEEDIIFKTLFKSKKVNCVLLEEKLLAKKLDTFFSIFDLHFCDIPFELKINLVKNALTNLVTYRLSANVIVKEKRIALCEFLLSKKNNLLKNNIVLLFNNIKYIVPFVSKLENKKEIDLEENEFSKFILETVDILKKIGVKVVIPRELQKLVSPKTIINAERNPSNTYLGLDSFNFDWKLALGNKKLSVEEFMKLVKSGKKLIYWNKIWIKLDVDDVAKIIEKLNKAPALNSLFVIKNVFTKNYDVDKSFVKIVENLLSKKYNNEEIETPSKLNAVLRSYQLRGYKWILDNFNFGFGCILADDMGLGKTIQTITVILKLKECGLLTNGALICCPASLLTNWQNEIKKFADSLSICLFHGAHRKIDNSDIVLSSYETCISSIKRNNKFKEFSLFVIDEAHYIKNASSKRAICIKMISAKYKLALSGTIVENNVSELWSIFDFILPSYLGSLKKFNAEFAKPIEIDRNKNVTKELVKITSPFILRRLKSDKSIAKDLPEKIIIDEYAKLSVKQVALYEACVQSGLKSLEICDKQNKLGIILGMITSLKQISNHPANFDKKSELKAKLSGKTSLAIELIKLIIATKEKVIIFSQYVEMLNILKKIIYTEMRIEALLLTGSMSQKERDKVITKFMDKKDFSQNNSIFLVSIKAGGVGLNLTGANHVIHYDLWFNPAVENQATDRVFRIGQDKNVIIHRLISSGTIDEKLDTMIKAKSSLANEVIKEGESWIKNLSKDELKNLLKYF